MASKLPRLTSFMIQRSPVRGVHTSMTVSQSDKGCGVSNKQADILKQKTPVGKLEEQPNIHPAQEKHPLPEYPGGVNPKTGEVGGPKGPEPTRYGDWERKGRVTDF